MRASRTSILKRLLLVCACALPAASSFAITSTDIDYQKGVSAGRAMAADYVDTNAADWTTDFDQKSDAEFQLVALQQSYALSNEPQLKKTASYFAGVVDGIQDYISLMNSVGNPVWFTSTDTVAAPAPVSRIVSAKRARTSPDTVSARRPAE